MQGVLKGLRIRDGGTERWAKPTQRAIVGWARRVGSAHRFSRERPNGGISKRSYQPAPSATSNVGQRKLALRGEMGEYCLSYIKRVALII